MGGMLEKAKESWSLAEEFRGCGVSLNFAANRFYYSLYQIADEFNQSSAGKKFAKHDKESVHELMRKVVNEAVPLGKRNLFKAFRELWEHRVKADYFPGYITPEELDDQLVNEAKELFALFEKQLP